MSEQNGDASDHAGEGEGPLEPALAGRLDTMHRTLSTLGMRIDALVTSTTTYRAALTDRLTEYTELVSKLTRAQAADLEEYRRANEQAAAELRRSLTGSEEALRNVTGRIEAMASTGDDDATRELLAELRTVHESQEQLSRFVTESLDRFGDRVLDRIGALPQETAHQLASSDTAGGAEVLEEIREALLDVASGEVMGALWDEFRGARVSIDEVRLAAERAEGAAREAADAAGREPSVVDPTEALEPLRSDVTTLVDAVRDLLAQAEVVDEPAPEDTGMLTAVAADVAALRNELAVGLVVEPSDALSGAIDQLRADVAGLDTRLDAMGELQRAVAGLRAATEAASEPSAPDDGPDVVLVALDAGIDRLGIAIAALDARVSDVAAAASDVQQVQRSVDGLSEQLGAVDEVRASVDSLSERMGAVDGVRASVDSLSERMGAVDEVQRSLDVLSGRLGGVDEVRRAVDELRALVEEAASSAADAPTEDDRTPEELQAVRDSVIALGERLDSIGVLHDAVASLRDEVRAAAVEEPAVAAMSEDLEGELATLRSGVDGIDGELRAVRSGIEDVIARLDEGLVLADDVAPPPAVPGELTDQLALLRDELTAGFGSLREMAAADDTPAPAPAPEPVDLTPVTELLEHVRDDLAELPNRIDIPAPVAAAPAETPTDGDRYATLDPDVVDLLREEIRAAGEVPEDLLGQLRTELVALRRRIKLRAEGEILTDEQLTLIADAVARRLAE